MSSAQIRTVLEPEREIKVCAETDVVVVGGGPAGVAAAAAAARNGAKTILLERYGHLGGMATGGLVILIMPMSDGTSQQQIAGICQEIVDRLDAIGGAIHPKRDDLGSSDKQLVDRWKQHSFCVVEGRVRLSVFVDPEALKCVLNDMVEEAGVKLLLHSWSTRAIVQNDEVQGIIFESKSGRQAILGKITIDTTGDGDVFASAGAPFDCTLYPEMRSSKLALVSRLGNVDVNKYMEFKTNQAEKYAGLIRELETLGGLTLYIRSWREDIIWVNNFIPGLNPLNVEDLTWLEVSVRKRMLITHNFLKEHVPGFKDSFIVDTASQAGVRSSRRLTGEYILTGKDIISGTVFPDTIAVCPDFRFHVSEEHSHWHIPYRALIPRKIENLLVAGRCFSSDMIANDLLAPIQFCVAMGQAAGTAAALAVQSGIRPRKVNYQTLQTSLRKQNVPLPGDSSIRSS